MDIIDAHIHCGNNTRTKHFPIEEVEASLDDANAAGAVVFPFPEDIYRIADTPESRRRANQYVLRVAKTRPNIFPFYFIWNDFHLPEDLSHYDGIKWHRHQDEPRYNYESPHCAQALHRIRDLGLPIVLEEEFENTTRLITENGDLTFIIPHMGLLNGGCERMDCFFPMDNVYFDTAVAPLQQITRILQAVGPQRILFGSDVSGTSEPFFNYPRVELLKLQRLELTDADRRLLLAGNIRRLLSRKKPSARQGM